MPQSPAFRHRKSLGQHFLKDPDTAVRIADAIPPGAMDATVLEIGPGAGILTGPLLNRYEGRLYVSEIDKRAIDLIKRSVGVAEGNILEGDFLRFDLTILPSPLYIVGNFPYNISSQIIFRMLENKELVPALVGMFQREMAERICASSGSRDYGVISVWTRLFYDGEILFELPPEAFDPPPKVHSAVIRLIRKQNYPAGAEDPGLLRLVKTAFQQRRKKLSNALGSVPGAKEALVELGWQDLRAERLEPEQYILLNQCIQRQ